MDVGEDLTPARKRHRPAREMIPDLGEDPGIADRTAPDHEAARPRRGQHFRRIEGGRDVAVGQNGTGEFPRRARDQVVADVSPVHLENRPSMDRHQIDGMFPEEREECLEGALIIESEPGLDGELSRDCIPQRPENAIDAVQVPQESSPRALAVDDRRGTSEVQVDGGDRVVSEFPSRPDQRGNVVSDHLRDDRTARGIARDRFQDGLVETRGRVDPEILGVVEVGAPVSGHQLPEGPVGHVLHGCQRQERHGRCEQGIEIRWWGHGSFSGPLDVM